MDASNIMESDNEQIPLDQLCSQGLVNDVRERHFAGEDLRERDLFRACESGNIDLVKFFFEHPEHEGCKYAKIDVNLLSTGPLTGACKSGNLDLVKYLISIGAIPGTRKAIVTEEIGGQKVTREKIVPYDNTPVTSAVEHGRLEIFKYLVINEKVLLKQDELFTLLCVSANNGDVGIMELISSKVPDIHANYDQVFIEACMGGNANMVIALISKFNTIAGGDYFAGSSDAKVTLSQGFCDACRKGRVAVVATLLSKGLIHQHIGIRQIERDALVAAAGSGVTKLIDVLSQAQFNVVQYGQEMLASVSSDSQDMLKYLEGLGICKSHRTTDEFVGF